MAIRLKKHTPLQVQCLLEIELIVRVL